MENGILKIALCDDQLLDREIIKLYLGMFFMERGINIKIDEFSSGAELLEADLSSYSIAFLDIYMGEITGIETAKKFLEQNKDIKILFCSSSPEFSQEFLEMGAFGYFIKPLSNQKFNATMSRLIDGK